MFNRNNNNENIIDYLHRYDVSADAAQEFQSKMSEIPPADCFLPESDEVYLEYNVPLDLELGVLAQIVQFGLASVIDPLSSNQILTRMMYGIPTGSSLEVAAKDFFYGRVGAFSLTSIGPSTFRACYAAYRLRELIKSRSVTVKVVSNPALTLYRVVITGSNCPTMVYDPFINPTKIYTEEYHAQHVLHLYPEADEEHKIYQFKVTPEICKHLSERLGDIKLTMCILLAEKNSIPKWMANSKYLESLECLDILPEQYESTTKFALAFLADKIKSSSFSAAKSEPGTPELMRSSVNDEEDLPAYMVDLDLSVCIASTMDDERALCYTDYHGKLIRFIAEIRAREKQKEVSLALFNNILNALRRRGIDVVGRLGSDDNDNCDIWMDAAMMFVGTGVRNSFCMAAYAALMINKIFYEATLECSKWGEAPDVVLKEVGSAGRFVVAIGRIATDQWYFYDPLHDAGRMMSVRDYESEVLVNTGETMSAVEVRMIVGLDERLEFSRRLKDEMYVKMHSETYQQIQHKLTTIFLAAPVLPKNGDSAHEIDELINKRFPLPTPLKRSHRM